MLANEAIRLVLQQGPHHDLLPTDRQSVAQAHDRRHSHAPAFPEDASQLSAQAAWEASGLSRKQAERKEQDAQRAKEAAQNVRYKRGDGVVIDGAQHVEDAIASGFREIRDWRKGASKQYALVNTELNEARRLQVKDGTLDYARAMLERLAA
ncbi:hypothetical protein [Paraburkholderia youngii]|uniref:hypothetical protein n=1 Tax=Paraburkholderia youngii TaxID=2782701 RepID=UPI0028169961|nr:hypothetical protein [Paraburkholderia youngii]